MELAPHLIPEAWTALESLPLGSAFEQQTGDPRLWLLTSMVKDGLLVCVDPATGGTALCSPSTIVRLRAVRIVPV